MAVISDDGQGLLNPILQCRDLLYCQQPDGEYTICEKGVGVVETFGYNEPSEEVIASLKEMGFREINPDGEVVY